MLRKKSYVALSVLLELPNIRFLKLVDFAKFVRALNKGI